MYLELAWWTVIFVVALYVLLKAADYFVEAAELIGLSFKIPAFIVGATMVAFGTSLPELATSISALLKDDSSIIAGNVVGSNISNIFLICGIAILVSRGFKVDFRKQKYEFLFLIISALTLTYFLFSGKTFTLVESIISISMLAGYLAYIFIFPHEEDEDENEEEGSANWFTYLMFVVTAGMVYLGSDYSVKAIINISDILNIKTEQVALTAVALGTSLPELAVTISAAKKNSYNLIIGNIIGSNIFNTLCVMGIPGLVAYFTNREFIIGESVTHFSVPLMIVASILIIMLGLKKTTPKYFGVLFIILYFVYIAGVVFGIDLFEIAGINF